MIDTRLKNILAGVLILALLAGAYAAVVSARSFSKSIAPESFRSFSVSAEGEAVAIPDIAEMSFSVITEGGLNVEELQEANTQKMNQSIEFVKEEGVEDEDIQTSRYDIQPRYTQNRLSPIRSESRGGPSEIVGYRITQTATVKIRDLDTVGGIVSGVVENGANSVSSIRFTIDDPSEVEQEARAVAIEKAQKQARQIAEAAGFSVGQLLSINESFHGFPVRSTLGLGGSFDDAVAERAAPEIEPGSEEVRINVNLRYEIR